MSDDELRDLLKRHGDERRPSLENLVAYPWERRLDVLGYRSAVLRDEAILGWATSSLQAAARLPTAIDLGCAFGNMLLMLDARLGLDQDVRFVGVDLDEDAVGFGRTFAADTPGYSNCQFLQHDITDGLQFGDSCLDLVIAADVLEHLENVAAVLADVHRVLRTEGRLIVSTPLADSLFKRAAGTVNGFTRGRLFRSYYRGKGAALDADGQPVMETTAGHAHISEMRYGELVALAQSAGFRIAAEELMSVMSGSAWFDEHPALLAGLLGLEAIHGRFRRPTWAHGVCFLLAKR